MRIKVLLTGKNQVVIEDFFTHLNTKFECLTCSTRFEDIKNHLYYFTPKAFIYCLGEDGSANMKNVIAARTILQDRGIPLIVIGSKDDDGIFKKFAPGYASLILERPLSSEQMSEMLLDFLDEERILRAQARAEYKAHRQRLMEEGAAPEKTPEEEQREKEAEEAERKAQEAAQREAEQEAAQREAEQEAAQREAEQEAAQREAEQEAAQREAEDEAQKKAEAELARLLAQQEAALREEPDAWDEETAALWEQQKAALEAAGKRRILIVDDEPLMLRMLKSQLSPQYDVATAISGKIALRFLEKNPVHLILLDYEMPGEKGTEVLGKIRKHRQLKEIPVVFLTGVSDREQIQSALKLNPQGYLLKPIDHKKLVETISDVLG